MTDAEWLIEWIEDLSHNNAFRIERARERMARVEVENATLRTEIKHLQEVIHHYVDLQSASRLPDEEEPKS